jgi:hypothetical protein
MPLDLFTADTLSGIQNSQVSAFASSRPVERLSSRGIEPEEVGRVCSVSRQSVDWGR